jgi:hypothetical protein
MTDMLGTVLVLSILALMAARAVPPLATQPRGKLELEVTLPLTLRLLDQRVNVLAMLAVLILGSGIFGERWISHELFLFALIATIGVVLFPKRYRFTTEGVCPNRATFRSWSEFTGWRHSGNVIRLESADRFGSLSLYVTATDCDAVKQVLGRHLPRVVNRAQDSTPTRKLARVKGGTR